MTGSRSAVRRPVLMGLAATLVLIAGFGLWATLTQISGAIVAPGRIEVERDHQIVQHPEGGVVESILVNEGQLVAAGQSLVRLDGAALVSERTIVEGQLSELAVRSARLVAERDATAVLIFPDDILDPEKGKWYGCKLWLKDGDPNTLVVRGSIGPFYRTQYWYKVN